MNFLSNSLVKRILGTVILALISMSSSAAMYETDITLIRSWGAGNFTFQTSANNTCNGASFWWIFDSTVDKAYAVLVTTAFTTGKRVQIWDNGCDGIYAKIGDFRVLK